jgi:gamma-glutamylcyclotransferase (GGCT)/AIG2-like uncharacterized protein YtfP
MPHPKGYGGSTPSPGTSSPDEWFGLWGLRGRTRSQREETVALIVFVYGTLRQGDSRNGILHESACLSLNATLKGYEMYDLGAFPAIIKQKGSQVQGELYQIDEETLKALDYIEGHRPANPESSFYRRVAVQAQTEEGESLPCFTYILNDASELRTHKVRRIDSGDWFKRAGGPDS